MNERRIAVVGAGITGAAAAFDLARSREPGLAVTIFEPGPVGGRLQATPFAGLDAIDEGADAFLQRVPDALELAAEVGLASELVHPESVGAAVWHGGLHPIPEGLVLGVPGDRVALARSELLSWRGKMRAAVEPVLPRRPLPGLPDDGRDRDADSIGRVIRARFGSEVHERVVDSLVGSIYATDTDRFSLAEVPQLAGLARNRSLLLGARQMSASPAAGTGSVTSAPIFAAPAGGMNRLARAAIERAIADGAELRPTTAEIEGIDDDGVVVSGERFHDVVLATPAATTADLLRSVTTVTGSSGSPAVDPGTIHALDAAETADVAMVTMHVAAEEWPDRLGGLSGYLVPKPDQRHVTAGSFASQKWAHWRPPGGGEILRVSAGRDGAPVLHLDDDDIIDRTLAALGVHLGTSVSPVEVRLTRWPGAFAQYRPHHRRWVDGIRSALPHRVHVAGSSFDGIGVPACVRSGRTIAARVIRGTEVG